MAEDSGQTGDNWITGVELTLATSSRRFEISEAAARQSEYLRAHIDTAVGRRSTLVQIPPEATKDATILNRLVTYCEQKAAEAAAEAEAHYKMTPSKKAKRVVAGGDGSAVPWRQALVEVDPLELLQLAKAADYLEVEGLLDLCCIAVANACKGRQAESIAAVFALVAIPMRTRGERSRAVAAAAAADMSAQWDSFQVYTDAAMQAGLLQAAEAAGAAQPEAATGLRVVAAHLQRMEAKRRLEFARHARDAVGLAVSLTPDDVTLHVWRVADGAVLRRLSGHTKMVKGVVDVGGGYAVSGGEDGLLCVWDVQAGAQRQQIDTGDVISFMGAVPPRAGPESAVGRVAVSRSYTGAISVWQLGGAGALDCQFEATGWVSSFAVVRAGGGARWLLAVGASNASVGLFDVDAGTKVGVLMYGNALHRMIGSAVHALADLGGGRLLSGSEDGSLQVWDVDAVKCLANVDGAHPGGVLAVCALRGAGAASGGRDNRTRRWAWDEAGKKLESEGGAIAHRDMVLYLGPADASRSRLLTTGGYGVRVCGPADDGSRGAGTWTQLAEFKDIKGHPKAMVVMNWTPEN